MKNSKVLFTDGEGPIVFKDLAFDVMGRATFPGNVSGHDFFAVLSLYDDFLAEEGTAGYQAGDTLALVVPHWLAHNITDKDILEEAETVQLVCGVKEYIGGLKKDEWEVRIISTAYRPLWNLVGNNLGIPHNEIACTELNLARLAKELDHQKFSQVVVGIEKEVVSLLSRFNEARQQVENGESVRKVFADQGVAAPIRHALDRLYWQELPRLGYKPLEVVPVVGGRRKIGQAQRFAQELKTSLGKIVYVGDSITDSDLFRFINDEGGLSIAVNGNRYALRDAQVAVATTDMRHLRKILDAWSDGGIQKVKGVIESYSSAATFPYYALVNKANLDQLERIHKETRTIVRGAAAALG